MGATAAPGLTVLTIVVLIIVTRVNAFCGSCDLDPPTQPPDYYNYVVPADGNSGIRAVAGGNGGQWRVETFIPPFGQNKHVSLSYYGNTMVRVLDSQVSVHAGFKYRMLYSPVPMSALGTRYIFSSFPSTSETDKDMSATDKTRSVLVISTHSLKADVKITFRLDGNFTFGGKTYRHGDILDRLELEKYNTVKIMSPYDLTGTVIDSSQPVTVISERQEEVVGGTTAYEQLLPVTRFGQEYVVAVDDNPALYQLQIISEHSDTRIMFSNGSTVSMDESRVYRQYLGQDERLHFNTSRPVMTALHRLNGSDSGMVVVPPISYYKTQIVLVRQGNVKILTEKVNNFVEVKSSSGNKVTVVWQDVPSSRYQVGTCQIPSSESVSITSNWTFSTLVFSADDIQNGGYNFSKHRSTPTESEDYWVPIGSIWAATGEIGGRWQVTSHIPPYSQDSFTVTYPNNGKAYGHVIRVHDIDRDMHMYGYNSPAVYSPLPVSALADKYIVSSCHPPGDYTSALVIATHSQSASINITFRLDGNVVYDGRTYRDGDSLTVTMEPNRTFTLKNTSDLSGTVIRSSEWHTAVFSGFLSRNELVALEQLPPVRLYGPEHVVVTDVGSKPSQMQILSVESDTQITFNNGSKAFVDERGRYHQPLEQNESLSFNTTNYVMTTLCKEGGFAVVPPVRYYINQTVQSKGEIVAKVIAKDNKTEVYDINIFRNTKRAVDVEWEKITNTRFKVGTVTLSQNQTLFTSEGYFTVIFSYKNGEMSSSGHPPVMACDQPSCGPTPTEIVLIVVAAGTGLSITAAMVYGGYNLISQRVGVNRAYRGPQRFNGGERAQRGPGLNVVRGRNDRDANQADRSSGRYHEPGPTPPPVQNA